MDIDAKSFAILSLLIGLIVAGIWDWVSLLLDEMDNQEWWEEIEEEDVDEENDRHESGKK